MARPTGSCPPGRKPLLSDRETALGRRSFRPSPCRGRHPSSPRRRGGSNIHSYFWPMWLKYSFPLVAQILVPTWLKYSLTFTHVQLNADHGEIPPLSFAFFLLYVMMLLLASPFRRKKRPCWTAGFLEHLVLAHMRTYVYCFGQKKSGKIVENDEYT